ncbi:MAG TPA: zf-HC2 domain-containing protein, partial [Thermoanaerobaculia bacterium]|nr:zf-HC2 domain-containing protein [Thermoanaerobaculia bacterium]
MNCPQARFLLYAHMDRELPRLDSEALSRHLAACAPCATRADSARSLGKVLRSRLDRAPAPARLRSRLHSSLTSNRPMRPNVSSYFLAAAVILMIVPLVADTPSS